MRPTTIFFSLVLLLSANVETVNAQAGDFTLSIATDYQQDRPRDVDSPWLRPTLEVWAQDAAHALPFFPDIAPYVMFTWDADWNIQGESSPFTEHRFAPEVGIQAAGDYWGPFTGATAFVLHQSTGTDADASRGWNRYGGRLSIGSPDGRYGLTVEAAGIFSVEQSTIGVYDATDFMGRDFTGSVFAWGEVLDYGKLEVRASDADAYTAQFYPQAKVGFLDLYLWGHKGAMRTLTTPETSVIAGGVGVQVRLSDLTDAVDE